MCKIPVREDTHQCFTKLLIKELKMMGCRAWKAPPIGGGAKHRAIASLEGPGQMLPIELKLIAP